MVDYAEQVARARMEKDEAFRTAAWSPLPAADRPGFEGLAYYPVDERYRFVVTLERAAQTQLEVPLSTGGVRVQTRVGTFVLDTPDGTVRVAAFEAEGHEHGELFLPFRDGTSGRETYGAGRYLDARPLGDDQFLIDFNLAYHPYCAYSEDYACPLAPPENWLSVPIPAGERL